MFKFSEICLATVLTLIVKVHPDKFTDEKKEIANGLSTRITAAKKKL